MGLRVHDSTTAVVDAPTNIDYFPMHNTLEFIVTDYLRSLLVYTHSPFIGKLSGRLEAMVVSEV